MARKRITDSPYDRCLDCKHRLKQHCNGPRTSDMVLLDWCAYMRTMKEYTGSSNAEIADRSGVSVKTIERVMALNIDHDIMRETARLIENAILGTTNRYPCYLAYEEEHPTEAFEDLRREARQLSKDNEEYRAVVDGIHAAYQRELDTQREEHARQIAFLKEQLSQLQIMVDFLKDENARKSKIIDKYL